MDAATTVVPEGEGTIAFSFSGASGIVPTKSRLYVTVGLGGPQQVRVFDLSGRRAAAAAGSSRERGLPGGGQAGRRHRALPERVLPGADGVVSRRGRIHRPGQDRPHAEMYEVCGRLGSLAAAEVISHVGARPMTSLKQVAGQAGLAA